MKILVQKFGGTSVHTIELRKKAVQKVKQALEEGFSPVVVVSAMGREGSPYATDTLIRLAKEEFSQVEPRELDLLMSCGEVISAVIMTQALKREGLRSVALTGGQAGIITDASFGDARIIKVEPGRIRKHLEEGYVVVVAGFQGITEEGEITTLGRGGSDTTAVVLGAALDAEFVDIFTDVEGVMTADPRIVPEAQIIRGLTYTEAAEIVQQGAKVIHHKAMSVAREYRVPLRVRSLVHEGEGTIICDVRYLVERGIRGAGARPLYSIAYRSRLAQVVIPLDEKPESKLRTFSSLAQKGISIDLINLFPNNTAFVVEEQHSPLVKEILEQAGFTVTINAPCAKVSLVGFEMADRPGVVAQLVEALQELGIEILQTGDSHVTISCLIWEKDMERAIQALHRKFQLDELC